MIGPLQTRSLRSVTRRLLVAVIGATSLLGVAGIGAVSYVSVRLDTLSSTLLPLQSDNAAVLIDLVDADTGLRGYELTGQASFLQPYHAGLARFYQDLADAAALARSRPGLLAAVDEEGARARIWFAVVAAPTLRYPRTGLNLDRRGHALFESFRAANAATGLAVARDIAAARSAATVSRDAACAAVALLLALTLAVGGWVRDRLMRSVVAPVESVTAAILGLAGGRRSVEVPDDGPAEVAALSRAVRVLQRASERRRRADRRTARLRLLAASTARELHDALDLDDVATRGAALLGSSFGVERAVILVGVEGGRAAGAQWHLPDLEPLGQLPRAETILALAVDDAAGAPPVTVRSGDSEIAERALAELGGAGALVCPFATDQHGDRPGVAILVSATQLSWRRDETHAIGAVCADLGRAIARARLFEHQRHLVEELAALDRAKAEFITTVSHELRTPLTSICGYLEMLAECDDPASRERTVEILERNADRLRHLVDDLLTLSRLDAHELQPRDDEVDLSEVCEAVASSLAPQAEAAGIRVHRELVAGTVWVRGDADQLERVLINLVANAVKFTRAGGEVRIGAGVEDGRAVLTVADTGIGIPEAEQDRIGSAFFRASNATAAAVPGTGLGLRIVHAIVERHGGRVELRSQPGEGSTFRVLLPAAPAATPERDLTSVAS